MIGHPHTDNHQEKEELNCQDLGQDQILTKRNTPSILLLEEETTKIEEEASTLLLEEIAKALVVIKGANVLVLMKNPKDSTIDVLTIEITEA